MGHLAMRNAALTGAGAVLALSLVACGGGSPAQKPTAGGQPTTQAAPATSAAASATPSASATSSASASATPSAPVAPAGSLKGVKDPSVAPKFVQYGGVTFAGAKFPPKLNNLPKLGDTSEGAANRYAGYSQSGSKLSYSAVVAKNGSESDADDFIESKPGVVSYDGGVMKCYNDQTNNKGVCQVLLAGSKEVATINVSNSPNGVDEAAKVMVEWMNGQK